MFNNRIRLMALEGKLLRLMLLVPYELVTRLRCFSAGAVISVGDRPYVRNIRLLGEARETESP